MKRSILALAVGGLFIAPAAQAQHSVASTFDAKLGGFVQMNTTWNSDENDDDNPSSMRKSAVQPGTAQDGQKTLRWASTRTRLFLDVRGGELWGAKTRAYTEFDFDGLKLNENTGQSSATAANTPRLRRAYMRWDWTNTWALLGQQTLLFYDAVSPFGTTYIEGVSSGRGGMTGGSRNRAPAFFAGHRFGLGVGTLELIGSVARHATDNQPAAGINDSGTRADRPAYETMAKFSTKVFGREALAAVSTYWGEEEITNGAATAAALRTQKLRSVGTGLQGALPLGPVTPFGAFELRGATFRATNMARWNLGSNSATSSTIGVAQPVHAHGGWLEANWQITPKYGLALGGGRARDDRNDVRAIGGTTLRIQDNQGYWLHFTWQDGPWGFMTSISNVDTMWVTPTTNAETRNDSQELHFVFRYSF
jgi:hypothetical protein